MGGLALPANQVNALRAEETARLKRAVSAELQVRLQVLAPPPCPPHLVVEEKPKRKAAEHTFHPDPNAGTRVGYVLSPEMEARVDAVVQRAAFAGTIDERQVPRRLRPYGYGGLVR